MVTVYIWDAGKNSTTGHASLKIAKGEVIVRNVFAQRKPGTTWADEWEEMYISWYPSGRISLAGENSTWYADTQLYNPDFEVNLYSLDEPEMRRYWRRFQVMWRSWNVVQNCAQMVARVLLAGGAPKWTDPDNPIWLPSTAKCYALYIASREQACR